MGVSDKTSRLHPPRAANKLGQAYEPDVPVKERGGIAPALAAPDRVRPNFLSDRELSSGFPSAPPELSLYRDQRLAEDRGAEAPIPGPLSRDPGAAGGGSAAKLRFRDAGCGDRCVRLGVVALHLQRANEIRWAQPWARIEHELAAIKAIR